MSDKRQVQFWQWVKYITKELSNIFEYYGGCENCDHMLCCKINPPVVNGDEVSRMVRYKKLSEDEFKNKYLFNYRFDLGQGYIKQSYLINQIPCPFLVDNKCSIYPVRPLSCKQYPFQAGLQVNLDGFEICPTATLIGSEVREIYQKIIKYTPKEKIEEAKKDFEEAKSTIHMDETKKAILDPLDELYEKMGITNIAMQSYSDTYPWPLFNHFIKEKKLKFKFKPPFEF